MGINDPLRVAPYKDGFIVCRGPETFYDPETREIITHETQNDAREWIKKKAPRGRLFINYSVNSGSTRVAFV